MSTHQIIHPDKTNANPNNRAKIAKKVFFLIDGKEYVIPIENSTAVSDWIFNRSAYNAAFVDTFRAMLRAFQFVILASHKWDLYNAFPCKDLCLNLWRSVYNLLFLGDS